MVLVEIATGYIGVSYERAYVWHWTEAEAIELFRATHPNRVAADIVLRCRVILSDTDLPFCTRLDSEGWPD